MINESQKKHGSTPAPSPVDEIMQIISAYPAHEQNSIWFDVRSKLLAQYQNIIERLLEDKESIESQIESFGQVEKELRGR